jgi:glucosamine-6-phosphate deaminase
MNTFTFESYEELSTTVAEQLYQKISHGLLLNDHFVLGLATGSSPKKTYVKLIEMLGADSLDLTNLYTFNLDEYYPIKKGSPRSYHYEMMKNFWKPLHTENSSFHLENGCILNGEAEDPVKECKEYEQKIVELGGIDLQLLGLGINGHIGFNEPGSAMDSRTRKIEIATETKEANSRFFGNDEEKVPGEALTMGIGNILEAKEIFLVVHGEEKRPIFEKMQSLTEPDPMIPASSLIKHQASTIFTDLKV